MKKHKILSKMEELDERINELKKQLGDFSPMVEKEIVEPETDADGEEIEVDDRDAEAYENKLSNEALQEFVDGILIVLGEMEMTGRIPKIETPKQAQSAVLGVIRRLYLKRSIVNKMARKFTRFGAKRFLRKQRSALTKSLA